VPKPSRTRIITIAQAIGYQSTMRKPDFFTKLFELKYFHNSERAVVIARESQI
jgi:hypothetical protein